MSIEKNRNSLKEALGQMKTYGAPDRLWNRVEDSLNAPPEVDESPLIEAVGRLSQHSPPASVWNELTKSLDSEKTTKVVRISNRRKWLSIAASVAVLLSVGWFVLGEAPPKITKLYAQETMQQFQLDIDWNTDEASFEKLSEQLVQLNDPQLNNLKLELDELNSARGDVEDMLKSYGQDPQLVNQLGDIERERSDIYRQIIELI